MFGHEADKNNGTTINQAYDAYIRITYFFRQNWRDKKKTKHFY